MKEPATTFPSYAQYSTEQLLHAFESGPSQIALAIAGLTEDDLRARSRGPMKWSIHEIVLHTTDSELQGLFRFRKVWSESGIVLPTYDQDAWATALGYQQCSAQARAHSLELLTVLRREGAALFRRASGSDWNRWGVHPDHGRVTLHNLLELYADHCERHTAQILEARANLGKPISISLILPERLY